MTNRPYGLPESLSLLCLGLALLGSAPIFAQEEPPQLSIEAIVVEPSSPGPDTLCRLTVKLANGGEQTASQLGFSVRLNGQDLGVYSNQLFMFPLLAGESGELPLFNFWTTETSRQMPADAKLRVEVTLEEAVWMKIEDDEEGVEVWTPLGDVSGLPVSGSITLDMKKTR